jgi:predicted RNA-binding protein YlqC (UPF0109 family)
MRAQPLVKVVEIIARHLVDKPNEVQVQKVRGDRHPRIELSGATEDVGKVIGKDGRTAQSIRILLNAAAGKLGTGRVYLDILD